MDLHRVIVRLELSAARHAGQAFTPAWADALFTALKDLPDGEFHDWARALLRTKTEWASAYERRASRLAEFV